MKSPSIYVAGHNGMVGSAIVRFLKNLGYENILVRGRSELDLLDQVQVAEFFRENHIDQVYLAAARVGGIHANDSYPAEFIYENLQVECNVIHAAHLAGIEKLLFLGSSCIYPKNAEQPMREDALLSAPLEPTNEPYAIAKIAGIKLCESYNRQYGRDYRSVMPTNLYGPHDNYHPENSHVVPALIRRFYEAVQGDEEDIVIWGSGTPRREFMHVSDMASACVHVMSLERPIYQIYTKPMLSHINVGTGVDCSIRELAELIARISGFRGQLIFDKSRPDGTPRKLLDVSKLAELGWRAEIGLEEGLRMHTVGTGRMWRKYFSFKKFLLCFNLLIISVVMVCVLGLSYADRLLTIEKAPKLADVIVILGGEAQKRPEKAIDLYRKGYAQRILVIGKNEENLIGAELRKAGIPESALGFEPDSTSTYENVTFSLPYLQRWHVKSLILVTSWFHSRRAVCVFVSMPGGAEVVSIPTEKLSVGMLLSDWRMLLQVLKEYPKIVFYWIKYGISPVPSRTHQPASALSFICDGLSLEC